MDDNNDGARRSGRKFLVRTLPHWRLDPLADRVSRYRYLASNEDIPLGL